MAKKLSKEQILSQIDNLPLTELLDIHFQTALKIETKQKEAIAKKEDAEREIELINGGGKK